MRLPTCLFGHTRRISRKLLARGKSVSELDLGEEKHGECATSSDRCQEIRSNFGKKLPNSATPNGLVI